MSGAVSGADASRASTTSTSSIISVEHVFKSVTDSTGTLTILRDIDFALAARET
ncbi:MAG: ABC transporter, partial [Polaromonas sp.]|nr:ABC transporter [Polaromonas sp.]